MMLNKYNNFINEDKLSYENYEIENFKFLSGGSDRGMIEIYFKDRKETKIDYFMIHHYGNIAFDAFYPEDIYHDLVNYVYSKLPSGKLKDNAREYYHEILR